MPAPPLPEEPGWESPGKDNKVANGVVKLEDGVPAEPAAATEPTAPETAAPATETVPASTAYDQAFAEAEGKAATLEAAEKAAAYDKASNGYEAREGVKEEEIPALLTVKDEITASSTAKTTEEAVKEEDGIATQEVVKKEKENEEEEVTATQEAVKVQESITSQEAVKEEEGIATQKGVKKEEEKEEEVITNPPSEVITNPPSPASMCEEAVKEEAEQEEEQEDMMKTNTYNARLRRRSSSEGAGIEVQVHRLALLTLKKDLAVKELEHLQAVIMACVEYVPGLARWTFQALLPDSEGLGGGRTHAMYLAFEDQKSLDKFDENPKHHQVQELLTPLLENEEGLLVMSWGQRVHLKDSGADRLAVFKVSDEQGLAEVFREESELIQEVPGYKLCHHGSHHEEEDSHCKDFNYAFYAGFQDVEALEMYKSHPKLKAVHEKLAKCIDGPISPDNMICVNYALGL